MTLLRYIPVWRRASSRLILYRCFEVLGGGGFSVQSADYYDAESLTRRAPELEAQFLELLLEQSPAERSPTYLSLEAAIAAFDADFEIEPGSTVV